MRKIYEFLGGRKQTNGYVALLFGTIMAFPLNATFSEYAIFITASLGFTSAAVAWEDRKNGHKRKNNR